MDFTPDENVEIVLELVRGGPADNFAIILSGEDLTRESFLRNLEKLVGRMRYGESVVLHYDKKER